jgi:hypothetical protein
MCLRCNLDPSLRYTFMLMSHNLQEHWYFQVEFYLQLHIIFQIILLFRPFRQLCCTLGHCFCVYCSFYYICFVLFLFFSFLVLASNWLFAVVKHFNNSIIIIINHWYHHNHHWLLHILLEQTSVFHRNFLSPSSRYNKLVQAVRLE